MAWHSQTWSWIDGEWLEGNPGIMGPAHAWRVARLHRVRRRGIFDGVMPDSNATPSASTAPHTASA